MEKFNKLKGVAAPMDMINIDTDQIIPKLHLRTIKRTGLGKVVFDELRFNTDGSEKPDFVLNQEPYRGAKILVAGDNFGCGSSREHAPWALLDFGIRCIISTSSRHFCTSRSAKSFPASGMPKNDRPAASAWLSGGRH
jgi:3-isopropylmalate/(R)-2-methylmalate dehydratase small subunit